MVTLLSLLTSLLTLVLIVWLLATVFTGDDQGSDGSSTSVAEGGVDTPGSGLWDPRKHFGRWETPTERDQYYRARGHETNWTE